MYEQAWLVLLVKRFGSGLNTPDEVEFARLSISWNLLSLLLLHYNERFAKL